MNNQVCDCDGIFVRVSVLVSRPKSTKSPKLTYMGPDFKVCGDVMVMVRKARPQIVRP